MGLRQLPGPVVQAPMAGGATTPELVTAVGKAGGLGMLAAGYLPTAGLAEQIATVRDVGVPFGVNLFVPTPDTADPDAVDAYRRRLEPAAARLGTELGVPGWTDDEYEAKLDLLAAVGVPVVTFTFGLPTEQDVIALRRAGTEVGVTVNSPAEAVAADRVGADFVVAQGIEAGGHRGGWLGGEQFGLLSLIRLIRSTVDIKVIAAGGIADAVGVRAALAAGALAAYAGTAFLRCPEAGTPEPYRDALVAPEFAETRLTRAYTGRWARGLANRFMAEQERYAPEAYPQLHGLTRPLRAAATAAGDTDVMAMWAGQSHALATDEPAAKVLHALTP
ncbi:nitronate monooxygenase [Actinocatenispora sera]|uniref:Propionate 3-nitronate monooxygenase n=1 Tax=Actinocatenispora sera TaxID=390989 RepID=A0A810KWQ2_9ACTN|nr:nitronate monooxygenase [Actinocatenispora sera]BCJ27643.1 2-nitropropane dioxygenase [Actinocatenispora sera]